MTDTIDPGRALLRANAEFASSLLKAMANEHRLLILCHLTENEYSVGELEEYVGISQSALSQHLARLRADRLVKARRSSQNVYYSLDGEAALKVLDALQDLYAGGSGLRSMASTRISA
jgi:DNA-binding transcriptional ArsR family regulator